MLLELEEATMDVVNEVHEDVYTLATNMVVNDHIMT